MTFSSSFSYFYIFSHYTSAIHIFLCPVSTSTLQSCLTLSLLHTFCLTMQDHLVISSYQDFNNLVYNPSSEVLYLQHQEKPKHQYVCSYEKVYLWFFFPLLLDFFQRQRMSLAVFLSIFICLGFNIHESNE